MANGKISGDPIATTAVGLNMAAIQGGANVQAPSTLFAANQYNLADLSNPGQALLNLGGLSSALAASTYLTQANAATTYQPLSANLTAWSAVNPSSYSTTAQIAAAYQPLAANLTSWAGVARDSGYDTFAATPTSANLKTLVTDETGSGALVFANTPTLVTPVIGAATGTSLQLSGLTASSAVATDGSKNLVSVTNTGSGNNVLTTSPTITTPTIAGTNGAQAPLSAALNDSSSVVANAAKFWNPLYFGNAGTAIVHRLNRLFVGEATVNSSDIGPVTTKSWLETLIPSAVGAAQFASVSATGQLGSVSAARTSDFRTWSGSASGGSQGVTGFGWNDDTTAATTPIAVGADLRGFRKATVSGVTAGAQISAANEGATVDITPFGGVSSGSTMALLLTNGPGPTGYVNPLSAALVMGSGSGSEKCRKGIISLSNALDTSVGAGTGGVTYEAYRGQSFRWLNSGGTTDAELWGDATGLNVPYNITAPKVTGGAGVGSSLSLQSTSGVGTTDFINFKVGNAGATEAARFTTSGQFLFGSTVSYATFTGAVTPQFQMHGTTGNQVAQGIYNWGATAGGANQIYSKSRSGTVGTRGIVSSGDSLASLIFTADDGVNFIEAARIQGLVDGTPGVNDMPGRLEFSTTADGAAAITLRLKIDNTGFVSVVGGSFGRAAPVTKTADFTVAATENWLINNKAGSTCTVTLPSAASFVGREIMIKNSQAQTVVSASSNVVPLITAAAGTAILASGSGKWATLVSDGTNWVIMAAA